MHLRNATDTDIPAIIELLKLSLGESSSPKSISYWNWKHNKNPFGNSPVLVAYSNNLLVGVRAMMQWQWQKGNKVFKTLRAVDTASHPDFQGKGIFSKLTKQLLEESKNKSVDFIFNTPNIQSKPGYLKMGWKEAGKLRIGLQFRFPSFFKKSTNNYITYDDANLNQLCIHWNNELSKANKYFTPKSPNYLNWRYSNNPVIDYIIHCEHDIYIAAYLRPRKYFMELRISELIYQGDAKTIADKVKRVLNSLLSTTKLTLISFSPNASDIIPGISFVLPIGPVFTLRNLYMQVPFENLNDWNISLGDLELF
jgi:N-acetylglutamate synthase-like GNAT family acetyltransferase